MGHAMRVLPNEPASWDIRWQKDKVTGSLRRGSVWDVLDGGKFSYLRPVIPVEGGSALEVGCGSARLVVMLARLGWKTTGIDFTSSALELARERFKADALRAYSYRGSFSRSGSRSCIEMSTASTGELPHYASGWTGRGWRTGLDSITSFRR
jgi:SAM-dependent methyltransferase